MLPAVSEFLVSLSYPLYLSLCLFACGVIAVVFRWRKVGRAMVFFAIAWSFLWSVPQVSDWLRASLEDSSVELEAASLPEADAIVVLGGGRLFEAHDDQSGQGSRLAAGARAWRAGRAPLIVLSGGGGARTEAGQMAKAIAKLGVPASALILEEHSHSTRDNAVFTAKLAGQRSIRRVLLVTSSLHMPRARLLFQCAGFDVIPLPVSERVVRTDWKDRWLPTRSALWRSGRALKEYSGLLVVRAEVEISGIRSRHRGKLER